MQISSRLRRLIMIFLGFLIMLFGKLVDEAGTFRSLSRGGPVLAKQVDRLATKSLICERVGR
jgi:hypothetical protein